MNSQAPTKLSEVRDRLAGVYAAVADDRRMVPQAKEAANALGKITNTCKVHLEACKQAGVKLDGEWQEFMMG